MWFHSDTSMGFMIIFSVVAYSLAAAIFEFHPINWIFQGMTKLVMMGTMLVWAALSLMVLAWLIRRR